MRGDRLHALLGINRVIADTLDYEEVLALVVDKALELTGAECCALLLGMDGVARVAAQRGIDPGRAAAFSAPLEEGKIGEALRELLAHESGHGFLGVPVIHRGRVQGMLVTASGDRIPCADDEALLAALADQAAIALDHASRYRELWQQSRMAQRELERAGRRKDEFLAMLAHELRNPLAAITNAVTVLHSRLAGDAELNRVQQVAYRQAMHMKRLLDDLLNVSRVTQGRIVLERRVLDVRDVVHQAVQAVQPLLEERRHDLLLELQPEPALVDGDPDRLTEAVSNLLSNAARYSPEHGHVNVSVAAPDGHVEVRVRDRGVGIAPDLLPFVFDLFVQSERSYHRGAGGLGIGLTLVRKLVELHGGTVEAHSEGEGRGSEFVIRLPQARGAAVEDEVGEPVPARPQRRRVLVVEDNADVGQMLAALLEVQGHRVTLAEDGESALERVAEEMPEVMLVDIGLPRLDGYEVARRVRRHKGTQPLLVAVTGYGTEADQDRTREAGFDLHLVKPVRPEQLEEVLRTPAAGT